MGKSYRKPHFTISKAWDRHKERQLRRKVKKELREIEQEIEFDPDKDFEAALNHRKMGDYGTKIGWNVPPGEGDDTWEHESFVKAQRK